MAIGRAVKHWYRDKKVDQWEWWALLALLLCSRRPQTWRGNCGRETYDWGQVQVPTYERVHDGRREVMTYTFTVAAKTYLQRLSLNWTSPLSDASRDLGQQTRSPCLSWHTQCEPNIGHWESCKDSLGFLFLLHQCRFNSLSPFQCLIPLKQHTRLRVATCVANFLSMYTL